MAWLANIQVIYNLFHSLPRYAMRIVVYHLLPSRGSVSPSGPEVECMLAGFPLPVLVSRLREDAVSPPALVGGAPAANIISLVQRSHGLRAR